MAIPEQKFHQIKLLNSTTYRVGGRFYNSGLGLSMPAVAVLHENQLLCNISLQTMTTDTLVWGISSVPGLASANAGNPVDTYLVSRSSLSFSKADPCAILQVAELNLSAWTENEKVKFEAYCSQPEGEYALEWKEWALLR